MIHDVIIMEFEKHHLTKIFLFATILDKVIKLHDVHFLKMTPKNKFCLWDCTYIQWPYWKLVAKENSSPSTEWPGLWGNKHKKIKIKISCIWYFINNGNILDLKQVRPGQKTWSENDIGNTISYDVK